MNCNQIRELIPDLAADSKTATPEIEKHIAACADCAAKLEGMHKTMALLDEWQTPEPSPYFDTRLKARLREEMARPSYRSMWMSWMRRPAMALSLAAVIVAGAAVVGNRTMFTPTEEIATRPPAPAVPILPGTAVGDLQALERNNDLYADFDVLDELEVQQDVTATP
jgi:predicted anti-sigma-YlaC factor YlaD